MTNLVANSSGDAAGNYYTGSASDLASVPVSPDVNPQPYACPATAPNYGPFTGVFRLLDRKHNPVVHICEL